jgi:predicted nucleotidyltransferase
VLRSQHASIPEFPWEKIKATVVPKLKMSFGKQLVGVVAFGSQVAGKATLNSDLDILIVLDERVSIKRKLYEIWDNFNIDNDPEITPHFVNFAKSAKPIKSSGLWLEIALNHKILFEQKSQITNHFSRLQKCLANDEVRRYFSNGHPYWIWKTNEKH